MDDQVVGAPLPQEQTEWKPILDGFGEDKVVAVHNPLPKDFRVQYARTLAQSAPITEAQKFAREKAGLDIKRDDLSPTQAHSVQFLVLKAGETRNLPGDIAQVAVRQLITYILLARNKGKSSNMVADPHSRQEVEKEIVVSISDNMTFFNKVTPEEYTEQQIDKLNPVQKRGPGRPRIVDNPPPGQGATFEPNAKAA